MKQNIIQINGGITTNVDVSVKKSIYVKKTIFQSCCNCENGKYLASIMDQSICDLIIDVNSKKLMKKI